MFAYGICPIVADLGLAHTSCKIVKAVHGLALVFTDIRPSRTAFYFCFTKRKEPWLGSDFFRIYPRKL